MNMIHDNSKKNICLTVAVFLYFDYMQSDKETFTTGPVPDCSDHLLANSESKQDSLFFFYKLTAHRLLWTFFMSICFFIFTLDFILRICKQVPLEEQLS